MVQDQNQFRGRSVYHLCLQLGDDCLPSMLSGRSRGDLAAAHLYIHGCPFVRILSLSMTTNAASIRRYPKRSQLPAFADHVKWWWQRSSRFDRCNFVVSGEVYHHGKGLLLVSYWQAWSRCLHEDRFSKRKISIDPFSNTAFTNSMWILTSETQLPQKFGITGGHNN